MMPSAGRTLATISVRGIAAMLIYYVKAGTGVSGEVRLLEKFVGLVLAAWTRKALIPSQQSY